MKVEVIQSLPKWQDEFDFEKQILKESLGDLVLEIYHIGSTAVPGLAAKPIIDIIIEVVSLASLDNQESVMNLLGYEARGEFGIIGRRYFVKGSFNRSHQIHAFESGDENIARHIAFRDYLKSHPAVRQQYGALKQKLASECSDDIDLYCAGKDEFVKFHESKAILWQTNT